MIRKGVVALVLGVFLAPFRVSAQGAPAGPSGAAPPNPFSGSVPAGAPTPEVLHLSFEDAIQRGLKQNLGALLSEQGIGAARGQRWRELSNLLPNVTTATSENVMMLNLATRGIKIPGRPAIVGPFSFFDLRAYLSQRLFDWKAISSERAAERNLRAAGYSYKDARDLVVYVVGYNYLQVIANAARVETAEAQVKTAEAIYQQTSDRHAAGLSPAIDVLRAKVELETRRQQLIVARNDFAKQKLALARAIGLPLGQAFEVTEKAPYEPAAPVSLDEALGRAYRARADYQSALEQLRAAEYARRAAVAGYFPTLSADTDYGDTGVVPAHSHGTWDFAATLRIPIFQGGRVHGDVLAAEAALAQQRAQVESLRGQIDQDVRTALLDLEAASEQVGVARSNVDLAEQTLSQARDRFGAGVTDTVEVVQAQEAVAAAHQSYIASLYSYNFAKIELARAMGLAEETIRQLWKGK